MTDVPLSISFKSTEATIRMAKAISVDEKRPENIPLIAQLCDANLEKITDRLEDARSALISLGDTSQTSFFLQEADQKALLHAPATIQKIAVAVARLREALSDNLKSMVRQHNSYKEDLFTKLNNLTSSLNDIEDTDKAKKRLEEPIETFAREKNIEWGGGGQLCAVNIATEQSIVFFDGKSSILDASWLGVLEGSSYQDQHFRVESYKTLYQLFDAFAKNEGHNDIKPVEIGCLKKGFLKRKKKIYALILPGHAESKIRVFIFESE
jgi:hypothetical protein